MITKEQILKRYWELATLMPGATKDNITGQLRALDALREELAAADKPNAAPETSYDFYRARWMREPEAIRDEPGEDSFEPYNDVN